MIEELKKEEAKYRKLYEEGSILDGLKANAFGTAINIIKDYGIKETYKYFKSERDKHSDSPTKLGKNITHALNLVLGKLWKHYKKSGEYRMWMDDNKRPINRKCNQKIPRRKA